MFLNNMSLFPQHMAILHPVAEQSGFHNTSTKRHQENYSKNDLQNIQNMSN